MNAIVPDSKSKFKKLVCSVLLIIAVQLPSIAQQYIHEYRVKNGSMYIMLSKKMPDAILDSFVNAYDLKDLNLPKVLFNNAPDSLLKAGWQLELDNEEMIALSKKMGSVDNIGDPAVSITLTGKNGLNAFQNAEVVFGVNKFKNKPLFAINDSLVTFFLRNHTDAKKVMLAGSFNNWNETALEMKPTGDGWAADVKLAPGKHWYKFIIDGEWDIDRDNKLVENDGSGNSNSVYFKPNFIFRSHRFLNNDELFVAGSFNNWNNKEVPMVKTGNGWSAAVYLSEGTFTYRFIADGQWSEDPENQDHFPNEFGEYNSVVRIGEPHLFVLKGFEDATGAELVGSFNNWKAGELRMKKTGTGWELPYTLGAGNYVYAFKINGLWVGDADTELLSNDASKAKHYNLVLQPNYTFRLKGFENVEKIFIAGDFNNWSPDAYPLEKTGNEWSIKIHLARGKHLYKFIADGKWILDPANTLWEQNEYETGNSVLWIE